MGNDIDAWLFSNCYLHDCGVPTKSQLYHQYLTHHNIFSLSVIKQYFISFSVPSRQIIIVEIICKISVETGETQISY